LQNKIITELK
jgi:hypothetical protein